MARAQALDPLSGKEPKLMQTNFAVGHNQWYRKPATRTIEDLPFELLVLIFKFAFSNSIFRQFDNDWDGFDAKKGTMWPFEYSDVDIRSPSLFPYGLASVCRKWSKLMRSVPLFWTRIFVFIDELFSVQHAPADLKLSKQLPIKLTMTRRRRSAFNNDPSTERSIMEAVMKIIGPHTHIARCTRLTFDLTHTSSLPRLLTDFDYPAPILRILIMRGALASGLGGLSSNTEIKLGNHFPQLEELHIDGHNFVDSIKNAPHRLAKLVSEPVQLLRVENYDPAAGIVPQGRFLVFDAFPIFEGVANLELDSLAFDHAPRSRAEMLRVAGTQILDLEFICLIRLSSPLTATLARMVSPESMHIVSCPLHNVLAFPARRKLKLENILYAGLAPQLRKLLAPWRGTSLTLKLCSIDDTVLVMIGSLGGSVLGLEMNVPCLRKLRLRYCPTISTVVVAYLGVSREFQIGQNPNTFSILIQGCAGFLKRKVKFSRI
ncbi:hypothetical protein H0H81_009696 [Sphagnurus paluster]|uniref:F-box domain-containing protein n=1 Tax=Sphagnurus paluster TaxID=117069 RepID=A0A9P7GNJ1_9AGAR|nr:hypothetical protein H0H81_009696 [Sphagnurus paluster]